MMSENKKTSLEKALLEAKEIEQAAVKSAKKILEESVISKIEEAVKETVLDIEKKSLKESVSIEVDSDDVSLEVKDGVTTINVEDVEEGDLKISSEDSEEDLEDMEGSEEESEEDLEGLEDMEDEEDDELFEVFNLFEEEEAPAEEAPAEEVPAEEVPVEGGEEEMDFDLEDGEDMSGGAETAEVVTKAGYDSLSQKLDDILNKLSAAEEVSASAEPEVEVAATETSDQTIAPEGEVEIVDDEEMVQQTVPAEETPTEEVPAEGGEEEMVSEDDEIEIEDLINELMGEISLEEEELDFELEDEGEELEEIKGLSHSVGAPKFGHKHRNPDGHRSPVNTLHKVNENIAHQEAKLAELTKENESLKESLREYKESFKVLRKQINEVQTFNAKLAYVNKLFSKGGLTNDEKVQIAENFDNVETIEEAKSLYNKIINESSTLSEGKTEQLKSKLKSKNPVVVSTKTEALYESTEVSRMKQLAGIRTLNN